VGSIKRTYGQHREKGLNKRKKPTQEAQYFKRGHEDKRKAGGEKNVRIILYSVEGEREHLGNVVSRKGGELLYSSFIPPRRTFRGIAGKEGPNCFPTEKGGTMGGHFR